MCKRISISPTAYSRVALVALAALTLIVFTGTAVRVTGSGLGCPDWPKCYGRVVAPLETHAVIEYANRLLSGLVGIAAAAAGVLAFFRRPFRRDLAVLGALLPLGVVAQAVLGGFTVRHHLEPGFVMAHFGLSMLILIAALALAWRARHEPGSRPRSQDRIGVWAVRALLPLGAVTIFAGTGATAAGPHAGGMEGQTINRLDFLGAQTLDWAIKQHARLATLLGVATLGMWMLLRLRRAGPGLRRASSVLLGLLAAQGVIGIAQYALELPAELVWVHVVAATLTWLTVLWCTAEAGRLQPRARTATEPTDRRPLETMAR